MTTVPFHGKRSAAALLAEQVGDEHAPISAMIEIADRCNHVCIHCYQVQGQKGEMTTDEIRRVLDDLADLGVLFLTISGGEATLRPDFLDIVAHARKRRFAVKLYTNGYTMTRELAKALADLAVMEVQISLYSHRAEVHDGVTRVPGSWERTLEGAKNLIEHRVPVVLKSPLMSFNVDEYPEWLELATTLGADYMLDPTALNPREDGDRSPEVLSASGEAYVRAYRDPRLAVQRLGAWADRPLDKGVCGACSGNVHIEANGEMRPCTQLGAAVGNARTEGVIDAWHNDPRGRSIRSVTWGDLHGCRDCDLRPYCQRCHADAFTQGGDALGPYESGCQMAKLNYEVAHGRPPEVAAGEDPALDGRIGPFRRTGEHHFVAVEDTREARDRELAESCDWILKPGGASPAPSSAAVSSQLVQIRRKTRAFTTSG